MRVEGSLEAFCACCGGEGVLRVGVGVGVGAGVVEDVAVVGV